MNKMFASPPEVIGYPVLSSGRLEPGEKTIRSYPYNGWGENISWVAPDRPGQILLVDIDIVTYAR
jgi:hypothetical protein